MIEYLAKKIEHKLGLHVHVHKSVGEARNMAGTRWQGINQCRCGSVTYDPVDSVWG